MPGGCVARTPPPVNRMTDACENITLPQTSFAAGNKLHYSLISDLPFQGRGSASGWLPTPPPAERVVSRGVTD